MSYIGDRTGPPVRPVSLGMAVLWGECTAVLNGWILSGPTAR